MYSWVHLPSSPRWVHGCGTHSLGHPPPLSFPSFSFPSLSSSSSLPLAAVFLLCCLFCFALFALLRARVGCASSPSLLPFPFFVLPAYCVVVLLWLAVLVPSLLLSPFLFVRVCVQSSALLGQMYSLVSCNKLPDFRGLLASIDANLLTHRFKFDIEKLLSAFHRPFLLSDLLRFVAKYCPARGLCVCVSCFDKKAVTSQLLTRDMQGDRAAL